MLTEKLNFLKDAGLLRGVPVIGELVHKLVENDPEGVSKALSGGIMEVLKLAMSSVLAGMLGPLGGILGIFG